MKSQDVKYKTKEAAGLDKSTSELSTDLSSVSDARSCHVCFGQAREDVRCKGGTICRAESTPRKRNCRFEGGITDSRARDGSSPDYLEAHPPWSSPPHCISLYFRSFIVK